MADVSDLPALWPDLTQKERVQIEALLYGGWPLAYQNSETGKFYAPHHEAERKGVYADTPTYVLFRGGEGGGKSVAGIVKALDKVKRGASGIMVSPDFEHFRRSLWKEFKRWCPWHMVVESQRRRQADEWTPTRPFEMVFINGASIQMSGIQDAGSLEGPNVNWAHIDEARHLKDAAALKVLAGRIRIPVEYNGATIRPQLWLTTTPRKNWLYEYFGPRQKNDPYIDFKRNMLDVILLTEDNLENLDPDYINRRGSVLTKSEYRVLMEAAWEDLDDVDNLVAPTWWHNCKMKLPALSRNEPLIIGVDAATDNDYFGILAVTRGPHVKGAGLSDKQVATRHVFTLKPRRGQPIKHAAAEKELIRLIDNFNVAFVTYDRYQLDGMMQRLSERVWVEQFGQGKPRMKADTALRGRILERIVRHNGNAELTAHVLNSDRKFDANRKAWRIVKRSASQKVDLAVCLSMAVEKCLEYDL
jgi:hypothetical protein